MPVTSDSRWSSSLATAWRAQAFAPIGMHKTDLADKALIPGYGVRAGSGYHTTSDFVAVLADVANKTLRQAYEEAPRTFTPIARRVTASDFRNVNRTQIGEMPNLLLVTEHGEYKRVTMSDAKESYALKTYGAVFAVTRQVLINDDLDAFTRMPQKFGASAARTESNIVWGVVTANAAMGDGTALFHANHGNLIASGSGAPSVTTIGAARAKMRIQTGLDGSTFINVEPRYLVVPAALETVAEQFLAGNFYPATTTTIVPERMRASLTLVVEPRLDAASLTAWYLFASPGDIDTLEYAYLAGEEGVSITTRNGFDIDGLEIKASLDFGAKAIDHRGMLRSDGVLIAGSGPEARPLRRPFSLVCGQAPLKETENEELRSAGRQRHCCCGRKRDFRPHRRDGTDVWRRHA